MPSGKRLSKAPFLWNGPGTHEIPIELYAINRIRLIQKIYPQMYGKPVIVLEGGNLVPVYDTDSYYIFRQESFFMWTFGVEEPACYGAIDVQTKTNYLFIPRRQGNFSLWLDPQKRPEDYVRKYGVHYVYYTDEMAHVLKALNPTVLLTLGGINSDSHLSSLQAEFSGIDKFPINNELLYKEMSALRVIKTELEIKVLAYIHDICSEAHRHVMRFAEPGKTEYQCEAEFLKYCHSIGGARHVAFTCNCASGVTINYLKQGRFGESSNKMVEPSDLCVLRMGTSYFGYCSDLACTFPVNGKFTNEKKIIYEAVLTVRNTVLNEIKPGVKFLDVHLLGQRTLLTELRKGGIIKGEIEQMVNVGVALIFQPMGIGHMIGLDIHDVGGFIGAEPSDKRHCSMLRTTRVLEENMVIAVSVSCHFNEAIMTHALKDSLYGRFVSPQVLGKYKDVGGVCMKDGVLVTKQGSIVLSKLPRTVSEVERWLAGEDDSKYI